MQKHKYYLVFPPCGWNNHRLNLFFNVHSHVSNFHVDVVLFSMILLQQNHELQFISAILCQNLVARQWHLVLVFPAIECGQCVSVEATLGYEERKLLVINVCAFHIKQEVKSYLRQPSQTRSGLDQLSHQRG